MRLSVKTTIMRLVIKLTMITQHRTICGSTIKKQTTSRLPPGPSQNPGAASSSNPKPQRSQQPPPPPARVVQRDSGSEPNIQTVWQTLRPTSSPDSRPSKPKGFRVIRRRKLQPLRPLGTSLNQNESPVELTPACPARKAFETSQSLQSW
jgi:hypothetical protein